MFGNGVEISLIYRQILGPLVLGLAPNHFPLSASVNGNLCRQTVLNYL